MKIHYDKSADALYLRFSEAPYYESEEVREGIIFDFSKKRELIGIEILDVSKYFSKKFISALEKEKIKLEVGLSKKDLTSISK